MVARCSESPQPAPSGHAERDGVHRYKWCNQQYAFVRSEEWQHHLAWCRGNAPAERPALAQVDHECVQRAALDRAAAKAKREAEGRVEGTGEAEGGEGAAGHPREEGREGQEAAQRDSEGEPESKAGKDAASIKHVLENGRAGSEPPHSEAMQAGEDTGGSQSTGGDKPVDARDTNGHRGDEHAAAAEVAASDTDVPMADASTSVPGGGPETEDVVLKEEIMAILGEHSEAILDGDTHSNKHWARQLKEFRGRTLVSEMQSRSTINPSADSSGDSSAALLVTVMRGDLDGLANQINQGVDVNAYDANKNTPLLWAAAAGSTDVARMLLDAGADLRKRGPGGNQPIHVAAAHGRMGFIQLCVSRGADLDIKNHDGLSARHLLNTLAQQYT